jgi:predicted acyl esterase
MFIRMRCLANLSSVAISSRSQWTFSAAAYRESLSHPRAATPDTPQLYKFALPTVNHVFMAGHRIMVQVQSSWFPLYDRNPQTFVPNIFFANAANYKKATQRIYHAPGHASSVELPLVTPER